MVALRRTRAIGVMACMLASTLIGCGDGGPELGRVEGTVTLDGNPLAGARVVFEPVEPGGSYSSGTTDAKGYYELRFTADRDGALLGKHTVKVTTYQQLPSDDGGGEIPERVPSQYNSESKLTKQVESGSQTINLELK